MKLTLRIVFALCSLVAVAPGQTVEAPKVAPANLAEPTPPSGANLPQIKNEPKVDPAKPSATDSGTTAESGKMAQSGKKDKKKPNSKGATDSADLPDDDDSSKPYVIGSLDVLQISVWNDPKLSGIYAVGPDGLISMQLLGQFKADGLTSDELVELLKKKLAASVMNDPEVNVQVLKINSKKYYIYGGCSRSGEFPLIGSMTFMDAFANCGGFREFSNTKKIYVLRGETKIPFNYYDVSHGKHMEQNRHLKNGDRIFVPDGN